VGSGPVSAIAAHGAADRWVMTFAFQIAGACEVATGLALRPAASAGRLVLMAGGAVGVLVAPARSRPVAVARYGIRSRPWPAW
jgi:hypothetical protein